MFKNVETKKSSNVDSDASNIAKGSSCQRSMVDMSDGASADWAATLCVAKQRLNASNVVGITRFILGNIGRHPAKAKGFDPSGADIFMFNASVTGTMR